MNFIQLLAVPYSFSWQKTHFPSGLINNHNYSAFNAITYSTLYHLMSQIKGGGVIVLFFAAVIMLNLNIHIPLLWSTDKWLWLTTRGS